MSTILIYTSPAKGHLYPMMDVAIALANEGHRVVVQTMAAEREVVRAAGVEHRSIAPAIERLPLTDHEGSNPLAQLKATFGCWLRRAPHEVADLRAASVELEPDLLVIDANTWGAAAFAEAEDRPWAMFLPYVLPTPSRDTPVFGPGFAPPRNPMERLRDRLLWSLTSLATTYEVARLNQLRLGWGARPIRRHADLFEKADVLLYRTAEPFEYPRSAWHSSVHAIGPGLWAPPADTPPWLDDLPHPRTLVSVSTEFQDDGAIVEAALAGLSDERGSLIVTTSALDPAAFTAPHERVRIERFLPHAAVVPRVDAVVTHGGMGTTQRALAAGVPVCVVPWGRDQSETARRVELSGAGIRLPPSELAPDRLRRAVQDTLTKKHQAERIARAFAGAGGAPRAVELLEGLLERVDRRAPPRSVSAASPDAQASQAANIM